MYAFITIKKSILIGTVFAITICAFSIALYNASPALPSVAVGENGEFTLIEYREPVDGAEYMESIYEMFPEKLHDAVRSSHERYPELLKQQEEQAENYLKSVGRKSRYCFKIRK